MQLEPCAHRAAGAARFLLWHSFLLVAVLTELLLSPGRGGPRSAVSCWMHQLSEGSHLGIPLLPGQSLDSQKGAGRSQVPQLFSAAPPRLWIDLDPSRHKKKINQVF